MPHRDPETGQFLPQGAAMDEFDEIEQVHALDSLSVPASELSGATGQNFGEGGNFGGIELYDLEDHVVDRRDRAVMMWAHHRLTVAILSTQTADGSFRAGVELSTSSNRQVDARSNNAGGDAPETGGAFSVEHRGDKRDNDTQDVLGPLLTGIAHGPITDGGTGVGGAGASDFEEWEGPVQVDPTFDARDSIFVNGFFEQSNVSDASLYANLQVWHVYGVLEG